MVQGACAFRASDNLWLPIGQVSLLCRAFVLPTAQSEVLPTVSMKYVPHIIPTLHSPACVICFPACRRCGRGGVDKPGLCAEQGDAQGPGVGRQGSRPKEAFTSGTQKGGAHKEPFCTKGAPTHDLHAALVCSTGCQDQASEEPRGLCRKPPLQAARASVDLRYSIGRCGKERVPHIVSLMFQIPMTCRLKAPSMGIPHVFPNDTPPFCHAAVS